MIPLDSDPPWSGTAGIYPHIVAGYWTGEAQRVGEKSTQKNK